MRRLTIPTMVTLFGAMSAFLSGCPIWTGPEGRYPILDSGPNPRPDVSVIPGRCTTNESCLASQYCNVSTGECVSTNTCSSSASCRAGYYCDARGACVPGCLTNDNCTSLGTGLTCNLNTSRCEPSGRCQSNTDCRTAGEECVAGSCRPSSSLCASNLQCPAGNDCVDGRCLATCNASNCTNGRVCVGGYCQDPTGTGCGACTPEQVCSNGSCLAACRMDSDCGTGRFCDHGACRTDDRRTPPECTPPAVGCTQGSVCVGGICRISCPNGTNLECMLRDPNITTCDATLRICRLPGETDPQCRRNTDCRPDVQCINGQCR